MANICNVCKTFGIFQQSPSEPASRPLEDKDGIGPKLEHYKIVRDLRLSAESGCIFCNYIWNNGRFVSLQSMEWYPGTEEELLNDLDILQIELRAEYRPNYNYLRLIFSTSVQLDHGGRRDFCADLFFQDVIVHGDRLPQEGLTPSLSAPSDLKTLRAALPYQSPEDSLESSTQSENSFKAASSWLSTCLLGHPGCFPRPELIQWHPNRLVYIGTTNAPALCLKIGDDIPDDASYMSLSHC